ncbi:MAG: hypothetical protein EAZ60_08235 [Oscillatoriales cyanobacterium]|nr:MAG: hypothetical protein EAZ83_29185 [Oscillatoriales cyanobacterium]TAE98989.1 MAG: hypothetical protein EAZ79_06280 [Oscillatoriales cyanobacterium]TAF14317.1 MAG: hypothetical protein EAZ73_29075 [Oscillatoriales cyanobacterium]TAF30383.1 MAG: hypothetical protein EAZ69_22645 [Oscillatoriales cyanobacterium]TAF56978.1 MAG: hypothetical protein EAZ60_08235 [Oscillatoriales cyanobacterium]
MLHLNFLYFQKTQLESLIKPLGLCSSLKLFLANLKTSKAQFCLIILFQIDEVRCWDAIPLVGMRALLW